VANAALSHRELSQIIEKTQKVTRERLPSSTYENGIPRSAITEICGSAKVEWLVHFFSDNPSLKILWVEQNFTLLPTSFLQLGLNPNRVIYVEAKKDPVKLLRKALKFQIFDCIVAPSVFEEERVLKALQLLSEKANAATLLLGETPRKAWPIALQLEIHRKANKTGNKFGKSAFDIRIVKEKGSILGASLL
jgi:hypothetical protein